MTGARTATVALLAVALSLPLAAPVHSARAAATAIVVRVGIFHAYLPGRTAVTYDPVQVPAGALAIVVGLSTAGGTMVTLTVKGVQAHREYGAHVHTGRCGANPAVAGPHFQNVPDPHQPSTDPAYANPRNEIWLDLHTDAAGKGHAMSIVDWTFAGRAARSVVIHEHHTNTGPGEAGTAGARLACLDVPFR